MELSTVIGMGVGFILIVISLAMGGNPMDFVDIASIVIVFGGCICAVVASYPIPKLFRVLKYSTVVFKGKTVDPKRVINDVTELATRARKEGLLSLEDLAGEISDPFFRKGVLLIVDATDPELVKNIMETELYYIDERHKEGVSMFESFATVAPAFGMIGTLIGLIQMLQNLEDSSKLGPGMATALVTTFYGVILANLIFTPIATKLKQLNSKELLEKTVMLEGLLSIQAGENPRIIEEKLMSFFPAGMKGAEKPEDEREVENVSEDEN